MNHRVTSPILSIFTRFLASVALIVCPLNAQTAWIGSQRTGDEARFLIGSQILRYDLTAKSWLSAFALPRSGATAMAADAQGAAVAYGTTIYRYGTGLTGESLIGTTSSGIESLYFDGNLLIAVHSQSLYAQITVFDRVSGTKLSTVQSYVDSMFGASHAPLSNRLYGRTQGVSPSDIVTATYTNAGVVGSAAGSPYHGDYPNGTKTWVFPDEARVVDTSGTVYTAPGLTYFGSLAGSVTDIAFNGDVPIVLRGGEVIAFTTNLLETGRAGVGVATGAKLMVTSSEAFVFSPATGNPSVKVIALSAINAPEPGTPTEPNGLAYTIDDAFPDKDGNLLLFSKGQRSLFRWSPTTRQYTGSIPLLGVPKYAAYSRENHSAYFGYETQELKRMDLSAEKPKEVPFVNLPSTPNGLATAGEFVFASDASGAWGTHYVYSPAGARLHSLDWNYYSMVWTWDATKRRMYFFRHGQSPNDLHYESIDVAGKITGEGETPYHGDFDAIPPIRVSPDSTKVVIGSGVVFNSEGLTKASNLANGFDDAIWSGGKLVTLRLINGLSQLQTWESEQFLPGATIRQFSGIPVRLFDTAGGLCVITSIEGTPRFTLLNAAFETVYVSPSRPLAPSAPVVASRTESSVTLQWQDMSDNEDAFQVEYRSPGGVWATGVTVAAGVTSAAVSGLPAGTSNGFRVVATNGTLVSLPSATVTAKTLVAPGEPIGEPYSLLITQIFSNSITLEWRDNANNETGFRILRSTTASGVATEFSAPAGSTSYTSIGLTTGTTYYFRIQAVNGAISGDLSSQVSATTRLSNATPSTPSSFAVPNKTVNSVTLTWKDNSFNEETFRIERSGNPVSIWTEIGRVPYNTATFTDSYALPNTAYSYRVKAVNASGSSSYTTITTTTPKLGGDFAGYAMRSGDVYYFAFTGPNRIERYNLTSRSWLVSIPLQAAATALWVDESGVFVAEDRTLIRFALDGGQRTPLGNAEATVKALFTFKEILAYGPASGDLITLNKRSGLALASIAYWYSGTEFSTAPALNRVFFRSTNASPSDIHYLEIGADGKLVSSKESPYHGTYPHATRTFMFPNSARIADESGTVYSTDSLTYNNNLGGAFTDMDFYGVDVPIILRSSKLLSYNNAMLESGSYALESPGFRVAVAGADALVFFADGGDARGLRVQSVPLSAFSTPEPGAPIDPRGLAYAPDDVFADKDGNVMLFSKSQLSLFRWSSSQLTYLPTLPLLGAPAFAAYSKESHHVYFAYNSQVIRQMDLAAASPREAPLCNLSSVPYGFALAGEFPYVALAAGLTTFSPSGEVITTGGFRHYSGNHNTWDPVKRRVYHFRDGVGPDDLHYDSISPTGQITGGGETPYHGDYSMAKPIRVSPDGSRVVIGSGIVFNSDGMTRAASLANGFTDAAWFGGKLVTVRLINGVSQLQTWSDSQFVAGTTTRQFSGTPVCLLGLDSDRLLLITLVEGAPRFTILNVALEPTYISPTKPLPPSALAVAGRGANTVTLRWLDGSDNEDGFRIEYRTAGGNWVAAGVGAENATEFTVPGLSAGMNYEFRVSAVLGSLSSNPTSSASAQTLSSPDQPVGEPYSLRVTRIFSNSITLEWQDNADNETGFRILRSTTASGATTELLATAGSTSLTATGLTAGATYYFRVQALNGLNAGDLSSQVSATTRNTNAVPSAPFGLAVANKTATSVALTWSDNSANEETFRIERSGNPVSVWKEIGNVPYNTATFTDSSAVPNTAYSYRVKAVNASGSSSYATITTTTPKLGGDFAGYAMRSADVYYFAFTGPNRIERYDLVSRGWLESIPLHTAATALWVDESGIFVAEDRAVIRFALNGEQRTPVGNAEATVKVLFTLKEILVYGPAEGGLVTMNKKTGLFLAMIGYWYSGTGFSIAPQLNRAFFRSTNVSPSDIHYMEIGADGKLISGDDSLYHGTYPSATRTFMFPNGVRVTDDSGTVYSTDSLTYNNSLGGAFTDLDFYGVDVPIILRNDKLMSYNNSLLETGSHTLGSAGLRVAVAGTDAVVFFADGADTRGLRVQSVALSKLSVSNPGAPVDPRGLPYTPDEVFADKDGNLLFFSKSQLSLFRWSPSQRTYLPTLPLLGAPALAAYSKETHNIYFAYQSQVVRQMDLAAASPRETPLFNLPVAPRGLAVAGEFPYISLPTGLMTFTQSGQNITTSGFTYYTGNHNTWDPVNRRVYHFRDGLSPNDLHYDTISTTGQITGSGDTPYHGEYQMVKPIRVSANGSKVVIGSGVVFNSNGLTRIATLANGFTDALWRNSELLTIRASGTQTQVQRWDGSSFAEKTSPPLFAGTPLRLLALNANESALITLEAGVPRIYILDDDLTTSFAYVSAPSGTEDSPYAWTPNFLWPSLGSGALTVTAPVLPSWLSFSNGVLRGTPREADSGDRESPSQTHKVTLRAVNAQNQSKEESFDVTVYWLNDVPSLPLELPSVFTNDRADDSVLNLQTFLSDPDEKDSHRWEVVANSNPSLFSNIRLNDEGLLNVTYAPYVSGSSTLEIEVTDASGASARSSFEMVLPPLPLPEITVVTNPTLSRLTGLYEQKIIVTNVAARAIAGFDLSISNLRAGVSLYNGSSTVDGGGRISHHRPMQAGEFISLVLEYYASPRGAISPPLISASLVSSEILASMASSLSYAPPPFGVNRCIKQADGSVVIEFTADPGKSYRVQYSEDAVNWKSCPVFIKAGGTKVQWIDRGPPWTDVAPSSRPHRFYRVGRLEE